MMSDDPIDNGRIETRTAQPAPAPVQPSVTVIERRGGGGAMVFALVLLVGIVVAALFLFNRGHNDRVQTEAVSQAARDVGAAADKVGDAAQDAVNKIR
ncbi:hypothetical protein [Sphingomonas sp.]|uniref:hypothetical protein n=1 Tax=Sphingomonas sp. TaxID=28214 RepID=UPI002CD73094|nr:hypothetical protein [Sphingomonas sp.]HWK36183.1 hypothetical protein [Sphingomonas sp.]